MYQLDEFVEKLMASAKAAGIDPAEVTTSESSSFSAEAMEGKIDSYEVSESCALGFRGVYRGRMGYASTRAFDDAAAEMLIRAVQESAELTETEEQDEIFAGEERYPEIETPENDLDAVPAEEKLDLCLRMEQAAKAVDPRIQYD